MATQHIHVRHAGQSAQGRTQRPVEQTAALLQAQVAALDGEHVDIRQRGGDRCKTAADIRRQQRDDVAVALGHLLPRPVDVCPLGEIQRDVGDGVLGRGAQHDGARDAQQLHFQGADDPCLDFLRRHARCLEHHLYLGGRDVRKRIDRQAGKGQHARPGDAESDQQDQQALAQRKLDQACEHGAYSVGASDLSTLAPATTTCMPGRRPLAPTTARLPSLPSGTTTCPR